MFTRNIKNRVQLTKSGVRWLVPNLTSHPTEIPDQALTQKLQAVKDDITKTNKDAEYVKIIAETFPNDLKKQL